MNKGVMKSLVLISQLGISMVVPIALCMFIGMFIAEQLSAPIITVLFFIIGALAGFRNAYILVYFHNLYHCWNRFYAINKDRFFSL